MSGRKKKPIIIKPKLEVDQVPSDEEKMSTRRRGRPRKKIDSYSCRLISGGEDDIGEALTPASSTGSISTDLPGSVADSHDDSTQLEDVSMLDPMDIKMEDDMMLDSGSINEVNMTCDTSNTGFERSLADDARPAGSLLVEEPESSEPVCSLCCCGEKSLLGQGDLLKFDPTPGFNPFKKVVPRRKTSEDDSMYTPSEKSPKNVTSRRVKGLAKTRECSRSPRGSNPAIVDRAMPGVDFDELSLVGYAEEPEVNQVFEPTGHCTAHHCCAAWSENVCQNENFQLLNVDKAVFGGLTQRCSYCRRFGATIKCRVLRCTKFYHYPCAASCGAFQDIKTMSLLCLNHLDQAEDLVDEEELSCVFCRAAGNIIEMLFCTSCGQHYHGNCLDPPVPINAVVRAGWQCPDCKICQTCRQPGDDNKILLCDSCDKGYHTFCLKPAMTTIPKHGWKCKNCRVCGDCGSRTPGSGPSSRWHRNYSVCDSCYQQRNKGLYCPICGKAYRQHATHKLMVQCDRCTRFVHAECDNNDVISVYQKAKSCGQPSNYFCPDCRNKPSPFLSSSHNSLLLSEEVNSGTDTEPETYGPVTLTLTHTQKDKEIVPLRTSSRHICPRISLDSVQFDDNMDISQDPLLGSPTEDGQSGMDLGFIPDYHTLSIQEETFGPCSTPSLQAQHSAVLGASSFFPSLGKPSKKKIGAGRPRGKGNLGIAGRKRSKPGGTGAKRGPKPKLKFGMYSSGLSLGASSNQEVVGRRKDEDEDDSNMHTTVVLFSVDDKFTYSQDMCVSCGSFGKGAEGRLLTCSQCGQCYHPYCVNIRITKVVLSKGWRCLDCTVCEGCGKATDESRLLLCDDCDISYHTYCLDPPLMTVPKGGWKCKWCVKCLQCGATTPGYNAEWQKNYTLCAPCGSCLNCIVCLRTYIEGDLIIQCLQCERWSHAMCDGLNTEEELERVADKGYHCTWCRPMKPPSPLPIEEVKSPPPLPKVIIKIPKEDIKPKQYSVEGVFLTESGFQQITSMSHHRKKSRKKRKSSHGFSLVKPIADDLNSEQTKDLPKHYSSDGSERYHKECGGDEEDNKIVVEEGVQSDILHKKKRQKRKPYRPGIGGFIARPRRGGGLGPCLAPRKPHVEVKPEMPALEVSPGMISPTVSMADGQSDFVEPMKEEVVQGPLAEGEKPKKKRRARKKSMLEQKFPAYIQEAFFGKELLVFSKKRKGSPGISDEESNSPAVARQKDTEIIKPPESITSTSNTAAFGITGTDNAQDQQDLGSAEDALNLFTHDDEIFGMLMADGLDKHSGGIDLDAVAAEEPHQNTGAHPDNSEHHGHPEDFDSILNSNLGQIVPGDLSHIDSKEVIDLFGSVLSPTDHHPATTNSQATVAGTSVSVSSAGQMPLPTSLPSIVPTSQVKVPLNRPTVSTTQRLVSPSFSPDFAAPQSPWPSGESSETEGMSYTQKSIKKWEKDEHLGNLATISPVLYANMNYPNLKKDFPDWASRAKQIQKLWRKVPPDEKQPFLQYAKDNRSTQKLKVTQKLSEGILRKKMEVHTPVFGRSISAPGSVNQALQGVLSGFPVPMIPQPITSPSSKQAMASTGDRDQKEVKLQKEQEQERRWKQLQQTRLEEHQQAVSGDGKTIIGAMKSNMVLEMPDKCDPNLSGVMMNVPLPVQSPVGMPLQTHSGGSTPQHPFQSNNLPNTQQMMASPLPNNLPHGSFPTMDPQTPVAVGHPSLEGIQPDNLQVMANKVNRSSLPGSSLSATHNQGVMSTTVPNNSQMPAMHLPLPTSAASVPPSPVHGEQMMSPIVTDSQMHPAVTPGNEIPSQQFLQSSQFQGQTQHLTMSTTDEKFQNKQHLKDLLMRRKKREPQGVTAHWQGDDVQRGPPPPYPSGSPAIHGNQPPMNPGIRPPFPGGGEFPQGFQPRMGFDNSMHPQPDMLNMPNQQGLMHGNAPGGIMPQWKQTGQFVGPRIPINQPPRSQGPYIELKHGIPRARNPHMAILHERLQQRAIGVQFQPPRMPLRPAMDAHGNSLDPYDHLVRQNHANQGMQFPAKSEPQIQHQIHNRTPHATNPSMPATPISSAPAVPFTGQTQHQQFQNQPMARVQSQPQGDHGPDDHDPHLDDLFQNGEFNILDLADPLIDTNKHSEDNQQLFRDLGIGDEKDDESKSNQKQSHQRTSTTSQPVDSSTSIPQAGTVSTDKPAPENETKTIKIEDQKDDATNKGCDTKSDILPAKEAQSVNTGEEESLEITGSEKKSDIKTIESSDQTVTANAPTVPTEIKDNELLQKPEEGIKSEPTDKAVAGDKTSDSKCDGIHGCPGDEDPTEKADSTKLSSEADNPKSTSDKDQVQQVTESNSSNQNTGEPSEATKSGTGTSDVLAETPKGSEQGSDGNDATAEATKTSEEPSIKIKTECCGNGNCSPKPDDKPEDSLSTSKEQSGGSSTEGSSAPKVETTSKDVTESVTEPTVHPPPSTTAGQEAILPDGIQHIKTEAGVSSKRTPLLDEQPLLLQDLLDQEKLEQQKQHQDNPAAAGPVIKAPTPDPYLIELDFEKLKAEVRQFAKEAELKAPGPHAQLLQAMNRQHQEQLQQIQQQQFSTTAQPETSVVDQLVQPEPQPNPGMPQQFQRMPNPDSLIAKQGSFSPNPQAGIVGPRFPLPVSGQQSPMMPGQMPLRSPQQSIAPGQLSPMNSAGIPSPGGPQVFQGMQRPPVPRMPGVMPNQRVQSPSPIPRMLGNMMNPNQRMPASPTNSVPRMPGGMQSPGGNMPMPSPNSMQRMPVPQGQQMGEIPLGMMPQGIPNQQTRMQMVAQRPPLMDGQGFVPPFADEPAPNPQDRVQHQQWLLRKEQHLQMQVKALDTEISKYRKRKKVLSARQRSCKKSGRVFSESDVRELETLSQQYGVITKKLEAARKLVRQHSSLMEEYGLKPQKALSGPGNMMQRPQFQGQQNMMMGGNGQMPFMHPRGMMNHSMMMRQQMMGNNPHMMQPNQVQMMPGKPGAMIQHFQQAGMMPQGQTPMMQLGGQRMMGQQSPMMMAGQQMQPGQGVVQGGQMMQPGQQMLQHGQQIMHPAMMQGGMLHGGQPMMQPGQQLAMNQQGILQQPGMMHKLGMLPIRQPMMQPGHQSPMLHPGQQSPMLQPGQQSPMLQPGQQSPMMPPGQQSPMMPPGQQLPMMPPGQQSPMMLPGQQSPMLHPNQQSTMVAPGQQSPMMAPGQQSQMMVPGQQSPMIAPGQQSPMVPPGQQSPMMQPGQQSPMMVPGQQSQMMAPGQQSPMVPPGQQSPMMQPGQQSPMMVPGQQSPMRQPGQQSPMRQPGQQSPIVQAGQQSPMRQPGQKSPMVQSGQQSPMLQSGQQSPMLPLGQPSALMQSMGKLTQMQTSGLPKQPGTIIQSIQMQMMNAEQVAKLVQSSAASTPSTIVPGPHSSQMAHQTHPQASIIPGIDQSALAHTEPQSPQVPLGHQSPVVSQGQQSPMVPANLQASNVLPGQQSPLVQSEKHSPMTTPGQQSPIVTPGQQSPMTGQPSSMVKQQSPQASQPSPAMSTQDPLITAQSHSSPMMPVPLQQGAQSPMKPATPSPMLPNNPKFPPNPQQPGMQQNPISAAKPPMSPRVTPAMLQQQQLQQQQLVQVSMMDNNPFSEAFQARERQAKLEQQSERQRIQLVQEIEKIKMQHMKQEQGQNPIAGLQNRPKPAQGEAPFFNQDALGFPMTDEYIMGMQSTNDTLNHIQQVISQQTPNMPIADSLQMPPPEGFPMPPSYPVSQDKKEKPKKKQRRRKKNIESEADGTDGNVLSNVRPGRPLPLMPLSTPPAQNELMVPNMGMQQKPVELMQQSSSAGVIDSANTNIPVDALPVLTGIEGIHQMATSDTSMLSGAQKTFLQNQLLKQLLQGPAIYAQQQKVGAIPPNLAELALVGSNQQDTEQPQPGLPNGNNGTIREPEEEEDDIKLTPEQLKQLEMLEKLPYVIKKKDGKPAKNDHEILMELHREEIQEKKKQLEIEENQKQKRKDGAKKSPKERAPRKRKKLSKTDSKNQDNIMSALKQLPVLDLCEPDVVINFALCQPVGSSALNGKNKLLGKYGSALIDGVRDFYKHFPNGVLESNNPPTPPSSPPIKTEFLVNGEIHREDSKNLLQQKIKSGGMPGLRASPLSSVVPVSDVTLTTGDELLREMQSHQRTITRAANLAYSGVNIPPSLPTPPPSNPGSAEEANRMRIRMILQSDSSVPSSSPELDDSEPVRYKGLRLITENAESLCKKERSTSPAFAIVKPTPRRANPAMSSSKSMSLHSPAAGVMKIAMSGSSVTLTLNQQAGNNPHSVVASLAEILKIPIPTNIQLNNIVVKQDHALGNNKVDPSVKEAHNLLVSASSSKQRFCKHCDVLILGEAVYKPSDSAPPGKSPDPSSVFCSTNCFMQWTISQRTQTQVKTQELTGPVVNHPSHESLLPPKLVSPTQLSPPPVSPGPPSPPKPEVKVEEVKIADVKREYKEILKEAKEASALKEAKEKEEARLAKEAREWKVKAQIKRKLAEIPKPQPSVKKWKNIRYKKWSIFCLPPKKYADPVEEDIDVLIQKLGTSLRPSPGLEDARNCILCSDSGDGETNGSARLLNCNVNSWVHLNCALWSSDVYETLNGALMNVHTSIKRGLANKCCYCSKLGATVLCQKMRCSNLYHFGCAINDNCMFFKDKTMLCPLHAPAKNTDNTLETHIVYRRVYVSRDEHKQVARVMQENEKQRTLRVGSLVFKCIGQLLPHQMQSFHSTTAIFPVGFEASRLYWSMRYTNKRCRYICTIGESGGKPLFTIRVQEQGHDDLTVQDSTIKGVWQKILLPIEKLRLDADMLKLFPRFINGEDLYGLQEPAILRVLESLPGVELIQNYQFRYGRSPYLELPLAINPSGCARTEPKMRTHVKRSHTLTSNTTSRSYHQPLVTGDSIYPYKTFVHSKTSQYRKMKSDWKTNVYLGRSQIQGLGLYAARDIEKHTMVIEYIGTLIRNEVANRKEKHYEESNRGIYMFRLDDDQVIDATLSGNPARYINHSCNPNCVAEVVSFEKDNKIIIISNRRITKGEELTYDYKFDFEDEDQNKIPCGCKAPNCRKWMN